MSTMIAADALRVDTVAPPTTQPTPNATPYAVPMDRLFRWSVDQYHELARHGILGPDDRVELLEGLLVQKMTKNPLHTLSTQLTRGAIERCVPADWFVNVQEPITTATSEPEADVSVVRGNRRQYAGRHPTGQDIGLVTEVSDSTLVQDRGFKKRLYAADMIPVYWIVSLQDRHVEVYTDPTGPADQPDYRNHQDFGPADAVPLVLDGKEVARIPVSDLLP